MGLPLTAKMLPTGPYVAVGASNLAEEYHSVVVASGSVDSSSEPANECDCGLV